MRAASEAALQLRALASETPEEDDFHTFNGSGNNNNLLNRKSLLINEQ